MSSNYKEYGYASSDQGTAHRYLLPALLEMLGPPRGFVLDLGCGNGAMALALIARGYDVWGVDASESGIKLANAGAPGRFFVMNFATGCLPAELSGKPFQSVISTEVIEHLYDPRGFLALAKRILQNTGGELIVSTPYHGYLKNLALAFSGRFDQHFTVLWDGGHIKFFSRRTLEAMLSEQGLIVSAFLGVGRCPYFWKSMFVKARVERSVDEQIY